MPARAPDAPCPARNHTHAAGPKLLLTAADRATLDARPAAEFYGAAPRVGVAHAGPDFLAHATGGAAGAPVGRGGPWSGRGAAAGVQAPPCLATPAVRTDSLADLTRPAPLPQTCMRRCCLT
jgi:hypothetical protein